MSSPRSSSSPQLVVIEVDGSDALQSLATAVRVALRDGARTIVVDARRTATPLHGAAARLVFVNRLARRHGASLRVVSRVPLSELAACGPSVHTSVCDAMAA
jgi:hypothetical protein